MRHQGIILPFSRKCNLVLQVGETAVDRRRREHKHARLHAIADDTPHQPVIPCLTILEVALVPEVVRFVDDDQVVVAPVHEGQVDVAREPVVTR